VQFRSPKNVISLALRLTGCLGLAVGVTVLAAARPSLRTAPGTVTCADCHEVQVKAFARNPHAANGEKACAACHTGSAKHVEEGGGAGILSFKTSESSEQKSDLCLTCHEKADQAPYRSGMHARRDVDCASCHSIHSSKSKANLLKTSTQTDTCTTCHKAVRAKNQRASHHPIREGKMSCSSCHNPHDSANPKMVTANSVNEKCYECHAEKRGPFLHEHAPVRENCVSCHDPHGSNHDKMLNAKQPYLCQRCHFSGGHPGNLYDRSNTLAGSPIPIPGGATISSRAVERECKNCHSQIHGSNSLSGPVFGR
jgi:DmsE family decaheme c-type cytochrome